MKISGIYKIQSIIKSERIYIGSAVNINNRKNEHFHLLRRNIHYNKKLQFHYNKYGESDLQFSILLGCEKEDLIKIEQYFIDFLKPWFNNNLIAGSSLGRKLSDETKKKMSQSQIGLNTWMKGRHHSEKTRKKIGEGNRGKYQSDEARRKVSIAQKGKPKSEEFKRKMSELHKGKMLSKECKKKISESLKGKHHSKETRLKMSESHKARRLILI